MINKILNIAGINVSIDTTHIVGELIVKELEAIEKDEKK